MFAESAQRLAIVDTDDDDVCSSSGKLKRLMPIFILNHAGFKQLFNSCYYNNKVASIRPISKGQCSSSGCGVLCINDFLSRDKEAQVHSLIQLCYIEETHLN